MIPQLIPLPVARDTKIRRLPLERSVAEHPLSLTHALKDASAAEEAYFFKLIAWFFVLLVLPAIAALLYIALHPDAFMMSITPATDLPDWSLGS